MGDDPRYESYPDDVKTSSFFPDEKKQKEVCNDLRSGAESGWDFTSRWIEADSCSSSNNLSHIATHDVIQPDLNAFLAKSLRILARFCDELGLKDKGEQYTTYAKGIEEAIEAVFYSKKDGIWYDYIISKKEHRECFYDSNFAPLWTQSVPEGKLQEYGDRAAEYYEKAVPKDYPGGLPASLTDKSEQQWDLPNVWPPLVYYFVHGLDASGSSKAKKIAERQADAYIQTAQKGYDKDKVMYEKYDANTPGKSGGGGEYEAQKGFGWSNGVVLDFIGRFKSGSS